MRAVAEDGNHPAVGRGELGAERGAAAPTKTRRRARTEIAPRKVRPAMLGHQSVFVDDDRIRGLDPSDTSAGPGHVDRAHGRRAFARLLPPCDERLALFGEAASPFRYG